MFTVHISRDNCSLLDLMSPALPTSAKQNLLGVLEVYISEVIPIHDWDVELDGPPVYTVDTLVKEALVEEACPSVTTAMDVEGDDGIGEQEPRETDDAYLTGWERSEGILTDSYIPPKRYGSCA